MKLEIRIIFYRQTTDKFILQIFLTKGSWCLSESKFQVCANFIHFLKKIPGEILDETDVDSCFYHNVFDISQSQHRIMRVSRGSNRNKFAVKLFHFCDLKTQQRYILQKYLKISKNELNCLVDNLRDFLKTFDQASKCIQNLLQKTKVEIGSTKSKDNLFAHYYNDIIEHPKRQIH